MPGVQIVLPCIRHELHTLLLCLPDSTPHLLVRQWKLAMRSHSAADQ